MEYNRGTVDTTVYIPPYRPTKYTNTRFVSSSSSSRIKPRMVCSGLKSVSYTHLDVYKRQSSV